MYKVLKESGLNIIYLTSNFKKFLKVDVLYMFEITRRKKKIIYIHTYIIIPDKLY